MLEGKDDIQGHLDRLEEWAHVKLMTTRPSARSCIWVGAITSIRTDWGMNGLIAASGE